MDKFSVLQQYFGHSSFRPGQDELAEADLRSTTVGCYPWSGSFPGATCSALCPPAQANLFVTRFRPC